MIPGFSDLTYYEVLDISSGVDNKEIQAGYYRVRSAFSKNTLASYSLYTAEEREKILRLVEEAYHTLIDEKAREEYERRLYEERYKLVREGKAAPDVLPFLTEIRRETGPADAAEPAPDEEPGRELTGADARGREEEAPGPEDREEPELPDAEREAAGTRRGLPMTEDEIPEEESASETETREEAEAEAAKPPPAEPAAPGLKTLPPPREESRAAEKKELGTPAPPAEESPGPAPIPPSSRPLRYPDPVRPGAPTRMEREPDKEIVPPSATPPPRPAEPIPISPPANHTSRPVTYPPGPLPRPAPRRPPRPAEETPRGQEAFEDTVYNLPPPKKPSATPLDYLETGVSGQYLRQLREARDITPDQVWEVTRIRKPILIAIEAEDYKKLPADVFLKGMILIYARFLGVENPEIVVKGYMERLVAARDWME